MSLSKFYQDPEQANHRQHADCWWPGAGEGERGVTANGSRVSFQGGDNVLELDRGSGNTS